MTNYIDLPQELSNIRSIVITAIKKDINNINYIPIKYYNDFDIMLFAVKLDGMLLCKVSNNLKQNYYIVHAAVSQNGRALKYIFNYEIEHEDDYDKDYDEHGLYETYRGRYIINDEKQNLINKKSIVLAAVQNYGNALEYASERLKNNEFIVSEAVNKNGHAIKFASLELQVNYNIICKAIRNNIDVIYSSYLPKIFINSFIIYNKLSINKKINYLFENIKNGTLLPFFVAWLKVIPLEYHKQLINWVKYNIYDYKVLFNIVFYKHIKFNHLKRIGYINGLPNIILSYLIPIQKIRQKQKIILKDMFNELQYY